MTKIELLLVMLAEEASEVSQAACKCIRFTPHHKSSSKPNTNLSNLIAELDDLAAMTALLKAVIYEDASCLEGLSPAVQASVDKKVKSIDTSIRLGVKVE